MADVKLSADQRDLTGKQVRSLRRQGILPAHLYGRETESLSIQLPTPNIVHLLKTAGRNAVIDLKINGESGSRPVVLRGVQRNPVSDELLHIDFLQISLTEKMSAEVQIILTGEAPAVHIHNGVLLQSIDHLVVEALPANVPEQFEVDVSGLDELDASIYVRDLAVPPDVDVLTDPDQLVTKVERPRLAAEVEREEAEAAEAAAAEAEAEAPAEAEEGEAAPEGEEKGEASE